MHIKETRDPELLNDLVWQSDGATHWADLAAGLLRLQVEVSEEASLTRYSLRLRGGSGQIQGSDPYSLARAKSASIKLLLSALSDMGLAAPAETSGKEVRAGAPELPSKPAGPEGE